MQRALTIDNTSKLFVYLTYHGSVGIILLICMAKRCLDTWQEPSCSDVVIQWLAI